MARNAPGQHHRKGIGFLELVKMFPDNETALKWIEGIVWPEGPYCPHCGTVNVQCGIKHKSMTHRCRECDGKPRFSVKTGTLMQSTKLGFQAWAIAAYLVSTNLKGISSMKMHRELSITQKSAWHLTHRLRKAYEAGQPLFYGPVEADESYFGGLEKNKHKDKKLNAGRGTVAKTAVVGVKDRKTNEVAAKAVTDTKARTLCGFVEERTEQTAQVYTDDARAYLGMKRRHESVSHSTGEYVRKQAHTNGMESFWSTLKRGHKGIFHKFSPKHLQRYVNEFSGRHNVRSMDTGDQMREIVKGLVGKRLRYQDLIADNGLDSGARLVAA